MDLKSKSLVRRLTHEGAACFHGTIHCDGKKVGEWRDDSWGGPRDIQLKDDSKIADYNKRIRKFYKDANLMKDPTCLDSIPCETADFMKGKCLDLFIDSCIDMDTSFKVSPTKAAKRATKNGREGVSFVYMKFHHYEMNGQPPCFSREVDSFPRSLHMTRFPRARRWRRS